MGPLVRRNSVNKYRSMIISVSVVILLTSTIFIPLLDHSSVLPFRISEGEGFTFKEGLGTKEAPYMIENIYQLQAINEDLSAHYALSKDLDASETREWDDGAGFYPLGNRVKRFIGSFDGRGFVISDLFINRPSTNDIGMFGYIGSDGEIHNLGVKDSEVSGDSRVGLLVGNNHGTIFNSYATGSVSGERYAGGLMGYNTGDNVSNSFADSEVNGYQYIGGLVGYNWKGAVSKSFALGDVSGNNNIGGFIGLNTGSINSSYSTGNVSGNNRVGGLTGFNSGDEVSNSYATGDVIGQGIYVGGLMGYNCAGNVLNSFATGSVIGELLIGGLIGWNDGTVLNSYASGSVKGNNQVGGLIGGGLNFGISNSYAIGSVTGKNQVGGLVGMNNGEGILSNSYAVGKVKGEIGVGGLVGYNEEGLVRASFWDLDSSGQSESAGGKGKTTSEMKTGATFETADWDFDEIWWMIEDLTTPMLWWQDIPLPSISIRSPTDGEKFTGPSVTVEWVGIDDFSEISHYEIRIVDREWKNVGIVTNHTFEDLERGEYVITVRVFDKIGNSAEDSVTFSVEEPLRGSQWFMLFAILIALFTVFILFRKKQTFDL